MTANATSLKARLRNIAKSKNIKAQVLLQNYMFERLLERLSLSEYKNKFILKGGMLVASIVGMDSRSTMDLDITLRGLPLTDESIRNAMSAICAYPLPDEILLTVGMIIPIRHDDIYGGYRVKITAEYDTMTVPFSVDVTVDDAITPSAVLHQMNGILDGDKSFDIWAYNIETILAEKIETILRRNTLNTRPRDFYDVYILGKTQTYDAYLLKDAILATAKHRGTTDQITDVQTLLKQINESEELRLMWEKYRRDFIYASDITYEQTYKVLGELCAVLL